MSQENERIWKINGLELELDLEDADEFEKVVKAFEQMDVDGQNLEKVGNMPDYIRGYCDIHYKLYDRIFGEGTGEKIFGGKKNTRVCEEVYDDFLSFASEIIRKVNERRFRMNNKYMPNKNKGKNKKKRYHAYDGGKR